MVFKIFKTRQHQLIAVCVSLVALSAAAQDKPQAEAPQFKVGESWRLKEQNVGDKKNPGEYTNTVYSVEADKVMFAGQDTARKYWWEYNPQELRYVARYTYDDKAENKVGRKTRDLTKDKPLFAFPMAVGSTWAYKSFWEDGANKGDSETDAKVVAYEKVTTPAGTFDAFKIEYRGFWNNRSAGGSGRQQRTIWYAPEAKRGVKSELKNSTNHGGEHYTEELMEYKPAP